MNAWFIILLSGLEIVALIVIVRLWIRRHSSLLPRLLWSVVLLVPFFGLLVYGFLRSEPETHPDGAPDSWPGYGGGGDGGGHDGSGHGGH
jgi:hypothetical protein